MKRTVAYVLCTFGVITSCAIIFIGQYIAVEADKIVPDSLFVTFLPYCIYAFICLLFTAVVTAILIGISQTVEQLDEINYRLSQDERFQLKNVHREDE